MKKNIFKKAVASVMACVSLISMSASLTASASFCNSADTAWKASKNGNTYIRNKCDSSSIYVSNQSINTVYVSVEGKCSNVKTSPYPCDKCKKYPEILTTTDVRIGGNETRCIRNYIMEIALESGSKGGNVDAVVTFKTKVPDGGAYGVWSPDTAGASRYAVAN